MVSSIEKILVIYNWRGSERGIASVLLLRERESGEGVEEVNESMERRELTSAVCFVALRVVLRGRGF